ncbi:MAG: type II toxin-antitoxin system HicB family antitoxin [Deltaproteobacteria bacterium]|nr:type II toxin-antitoxin system HicB family antitoxin [Deltaproteobacteria bacterium]
MPGRTRKRSSRRPSRERDSFEGYQIVVKWSEEDECYLAHAPALQGCITHGSTPEEAIANGREAVALWLKEARDRGEPIPKPICSYSGRMTL